MRVKNEKKEPLFNTKKRILLYIILSLAYLAIVLIWGLVMNAESYGVDYGSKFVAPCKEHLFGTDYMGRDMFFRSIKGLSTSIVIGKYDDFINWCVDWCMGMPHLILLILISFMMGRGGLGVTVGVAITHWPELTRLVRAEVLQIRNSQYVKSAYKMGKSKFQVAKTHIIPHVLPVYLIGMILLFPHAIMHEASITFLGFGLSAEQPAIGVILSESMKYIAMGKWWLALFPGLMLLIVIILFDVIGENLKRLWNPNSANE